MTPDAPSERTVRLRLPRQTRAAFVAGGVFGLLGLAIFVLDAEARGVGLLCAAFFGGLALASVAVIPYEIAFGGNGLTVRRRLRPDQWIAYRDITGFGLGRLKARRARLGWAPFENAGEVEDAFDALIEAGRIRTDDLTEDLITSDAAWWRASLIGGYAMLTVAALVVVAAFLAPAWGRGGPDWVYELAIPLGTLCMATGIAYLILRNRDRRGREGP